VDDDYPPRFSRRRRFAGGPPDPLARGRRGKTSLVKSAARQRAAQTFAARGFQLSAAGRWRTSSCIPATTWQYGGLLQQVPAELWANVFWLVHASPRLLEVAVYSRRPGGASEASVTASDARQVPRHTPAATRPLHAHAKAAAWPSRTANRHFRSIASRLSATQLKTTVDRLGPFTRRLCRARASFRPAHSTGKDTATGFRRYHPPTGSRQRPFKNQRGG